MSLSSGNCSQILNAEPANLPPELGRAQAGLQLPCAAHLCAPTPGFGRGFAPAQPPASFVAAESLTLGSQPRGDRRAHVREESRVTSVGTRQPRDEPPTP